MTKCAKKHYKRQIPTYTFYVPGALHTTVFGHIGRVWNLPCIVLHCLHIKVSYFFCTFYRAQVVVLQFLHTKESTASLIVVKLATFMVINWNLKAGIGLWSIKAGFSFCCAIRLFLVNFRIIVRAMVFKTMVPKRWAKKKQILAQQPFLVRAFPFRDF
jgi:hypothetical protein